MRLTTRHLALVVLLPAVAFLSQCKKQDETPPAPKAAQKPASSDCCQLAPATGLKEGIGRLAVAFPDSAVPKDTRIAVRKDGKEVQAGYGSQSWELPSGTYDVTISDRLLPGVAVQASQETKVKVGVLHVNADQQTRIELLDPSSGKVLASGYGERSYGLPIGPVNVQVAGQTETVTVEEGKVTEF